MASPYFYLIIYWNFAYFPSFIIPPMSSSEGLM